MVEEERDDGFTLVQEVQEQGGHGAVHYDRCKLHHINWWRNGGNTDLDNLLPVCQHHHSRIHNDNWTITMGANRQLDIRTPDGTTIRDGPPKRSAA